MKNDCFVVAENDGNKIFRVGLTEDYNNLLEDGDELVFGGAFLMHYPSRQILFDVLNRTKQNVCDTLSELRAEVINAVTDYNMKWYYANVNFEKYAFECIERVNGKPKQTESRTIKKANTQTMEEIISYVNIGRGERWCDKNNNGYMEPYTLDDIQHGVPDGDQLCYVIINEGMRVHNSSEKF